MSLLVTVVTKDGIIMASDSRTTWTHKDNTITYPGEAILPIIISQDMKILL